jgi:signal transduction histidine kinase
MAVWGITIFGMRVTSADSAAIWWEKAALASIVAVTLFFYHFTRLFTGRTKERLLLPLAYVGAAITVGAVAVGQVVPEIREEWYGNAPDFGPLYLPYLGVVYALTFLSVRNLIFHYRHSPSEAVRNRTAFIFLGVGCAFVGSGFDSLPATVRLYPFGMIGNLMFAIFTAVALLKHNLLDVRVVIAKGIVYSVVSIIIVGAYIAVVFSFGFIFEKNISELPWFLYLGAVLVAAVLLKPVFDRAQQLVDTWFWRRRSDYLRALEDFSEQAKDLNDLHILAITLEQAITLSLGSDKVTLLVPSSENKFAPAANTSIGGGEALSLHSGNQIVTFLRDSGEILQLDDLKKHPSTDAQSVSECAMLEAFSAQILVPLNHSSELAGILVLSEKRSEEAYSGEDLRLLRATANQTAIALENALLFASVAAQRTRLVHLLKQLIRAQEEERKRLSLRITTSGLHPPDIEKFGLVQALIRQIHTFEKDTSLRCDLDINGTIPRLPTHVELTVYRVIQEALSNVRKHSLATQVGIKISMENGGFEATVSDNGVGFNVDLVDHPEHGRLGLAGMKERVRMTDGLFSISSTHDAGTEIKLYIPLKAVGNKRNIENRVTARTGQLK